MRKKVRNPVYFVLLVLAIIGLLFAAYQTYEHYALTTTVCDFSETFSCSAVTESPYGEFPPDSGIATAFWGLLWWAGLIVIIRKARHASDDSAYPFVLFAYALAGMGFVLYLLFIELVVLPRIIGSVIICPFCTIQHVLIVMILAGSYFELTRPIRSYINQIFYLGKGKHRRLHPRVYFILAGIILLGIGMFWILGTGPELHEYPDFAQCLADQRATMYGFDACPHCNRQKAIIGIDAFKTYIDDAGFYVRCRPARFANEKLGILAERISSVEPLDASQTKGDACEINVGAGTPTWVVHGKKYVGEQSVEELASASSCPLPEGFVPEEDIGGFTATR